MESQKDTTASLFEVYRYVSYAFGRSKDILHSGGGSKFHKHPITDLVDENYTPTMRTQKKRLISAVNTQYMDEEKTEFG